MIPDENTYYIKLMGFFTNESMMKRTNGLLRMFGSTYSSEKLLSSMNFVNSNRNKLGNEFTAKSIENFKSENKK